jgi:hypothetical protein
VKGAVENGISNEVLKTFPSLSWFITLLNRNKTGYKKTFELNRHLISWTER